MPEEVELSIDTKEILKSINGLATALSTSMQKLINIATSAGTKSIAKQIKIIEAMSKASIDKINAKSKVHLESSSQRFNQSMQKNTLQQKGTDSSEEHQEELIKIREVSQKSVLLLDHQLKQQRKMSILLGSGLNKPLRFATGLLMINPKAMQPITEKLDRLFGAGSAWDKKMGGHGKEAAAGIGLAAMGGGLMLGKAIIDSSPAFQSLLKLLNFGIMLVLRPIGDFFALLFRPILIMLMRKFIIPFYQTVYPWFIANAKFGETISKGIEGVVDTIVEHPAEAVATGVVATVGAKTVLPKIIETLKPKTGIIDPKLSKNPTIPKTGKLGKGANIINNLIKLMDFKKIIPSAGKAASTATKAVTTAPKIAEAGIKAIGEVQKVATKVIAPITQAIQPVIKAVEPIAKGLKGVEVTALKVIEKGAAKIIGVTAAKTAVKFIPVVGQALLGLDIAGSLTKQLSPELYSAVHDVGKGIVGEGVMDFLGWGEKSSAEQIVGLAGAGADLLGINKKEEDSAGAFGMGGNFFGMANGGMIGEPIKGIGKSGKKYMFGESGNEMVLPMSKMARIASKSSTNNSDQSITINMYGNISSEYDMQEFQRKVLQVIEKSNSRRSRI